MIKKLLVLIACLVYGGLTFANTMTVYHAKWCSNCPSVLQAARSKEVHEILLKNHTNLVIQDIGKEPNTSIYGVPTIRLTDKWNTVLGELVGKVSKQQITDLIAHG